MVPHTGQHMVGVLTKGRERVKMLYFDEDGYIIMGIAIYVPTLNTGLVGWR